jgi:uncharacterized repeat protein (TIGR03803 family)
MKTKRLTAVAILACVLASASLVDAQSLQTLCSFNSTNGAEPYAALTMGNDGNFYGTTSQGGSYTIGTVFKMTTNGTLTTLASFAQTNGASPYAALTMGNDGNFYGTTSQGGSGNYGTVFKVTTNGTLTMLASFAQTNGASPYAGLTMGNDGNFYGTTARGGSGVEGGSGGYGTVFKVTTKGTLTTLVSFKGTNGAWPYAGLTMGNDGNFYGTTYVGGSIYDDGTVFKMTTNGTLTTLASFAQTNGASPYAALTMGNDGNFYGTTRYGGNTAGNGMGTVFKVTTNGMLTTLASFAQTNGAYPDAGLTLGNDDNFYGTTQEGGSGGNGYGAGTVFKVTTNGTLTTLASFAQTNGFLPYAALTMGNDGNFYGTTSYGGSAGDGTVFRLLLPPVVRPTLTLQFSAGCPQLNLTGMLSNNFVVQYSTNLAGTNWINLLSLTNLSASPYQFLDPAGVEQPARFYRAFMQ